jgi:putative hydroxymethylpyrimidine transporter CytX
MLLRRRGNVPAAGAPVLKEAAMPEKHRSFRIEATAPKERTLTTFDLAQLWFGAAISIAEIWAGGLKPLTALGLGLGLLAIVCGRIVGNGLMAAMARIGADTGLPTLVLTRPTFGVRGSYIPAFLNVLQLIGWTGWMLFVGYLYLDIVATMLGLPGGGAAPAMRYAWIILLGALCTYWAYRGHRFWQSVQRVSSVLLLALTLAMTAVVLLKYDVRALWSQSSGTPLGALSAADLVIAMSVSWLPLVADYSRYATKGRAGANGTFWGYFIGGVWMYAVGLLVAMAAATDKPDEMVLSVMGGQGWAWAIAAVVLVLLSTVTTAFLDIYSTVVSAQNLFLRLPARIGNVIVGVLGTLIALTLDVFGFQPFLNAIGAVFLPAFTIVLADHYIVRKRRLQTTRLAERGGPYWYAAGFNWRAILAWAVGFTVYDWAQGFGSVGYFAKLGGWHIATTPWASGASLPCIAAAGACYLLLVGLFGRGSR